MNRLQKTEILETLVRAGEAILEVYKSDDFKTEVKSDNSPVTFADKTSSLIITSELIRLFPDIPVISEENPIPPYHERKRWKRFFMIDPLDGTKEFIGKNGEFCINLALIEDNQPVEGWIYVPVKQAGWYCKKGKGIFEFDNSFEIKPKVKQHANVEKLRIVISRSFFNKNEAILIEKIKENYPVEIIRLGSSLKQMAIVNDLADLYIKAGSCSEWDTAPGQLMIEESGGVVLLFETFEKMMYNKPVLINPHFVMIGSGYRNPHFIDFIKEVIHN